jgi:hypothetical protein
MRKLITMLSCVALALLCLAGGFIAGTNMAYPIAYEQGATDGYNAALIDCANLLQQKGITLDWTTNADGSYNLTVRTPDGATAQATIVVNLLLEWRDQYGNLKDTTHGAGTFTTLGKNWTVAQISSIADVVQSNTGVNASQYALYLSDSTDMTGAAVTSVILPNEIVNTGLERAVATSKNWVSTGVFNCTVTKTATGAIVPLGWGLNYADYTSSATYRNSLIAYDAAPGSKNMADTDTLTETWTVTFT